MSAKPAGLDGEDIAVIYGGEAAKPTAVMFHGKLWQTGQKIGVSVGVALAVLEYVVLRGEKVEPPLHAPPTLPMLSGAL